MTGEELLSRARKEMWAAWALSSDEIGSVAADALLSMGMLVEAGGAQELERLRVRVAELEAATFYLAEYEGAEPVLYRDLKSAQALCDEDARGEVAFTSGLYGFDWVEEDGVHQQIWVDPHTDARRGDGPGRVTPLMVQPVPSSSVEVSADRLARLIAPSEGGA